MGRSTTQAVVAASVLIFVLDLLLTKIFRQPGRVHVMPDDAPRRPILRFEHVTVTFEGEPTRSRDVSFEAFEGESRVILGAAGSGKTVLLKTALGLIKPGLGQGIRVRARTSPP